MVQRIHRVHPSLAHVIVISPIVDDIHHIVGEGALHHGHHLGDSVLFDRLHQGSRREEVVARLAQVRGGLVNHHEDRYLPKIRGLVQFLASSQCPCLAQLIEPFLQKVIRQFLRAEHPVHRGVVVEYRTNEGLPVAHDDEWHEGGAVPRDRAISANHAPNGVNPLDFHEVANLIERVFVAVLVVHDVHATQRSGRVSHVEPLVVLSIRVFALENLFYIVIVQEWGDVLPSEFEFEPISVFGFLLRELVEPMRLLGRWVSKNQYLRVLPEVSPQRGEGLVEVKPRGQFLGFLHHNHFDGVVGLEALRAVEVRASDSHEIDFVQIPPIEAEGRMAFGELVPQSVWEGFQCVFVFREARIRHRPIGGTAIDLVGVRVLERE